MAKPCLVCGVRVNYFRKYSSGFVLENSYAIKILVEALGGSESPYFVVGNEDAFRLKIHSTWKILT